MEADNSTRATLLILAGGLLIGLAIGVVVFVGLPAGQEATSGAALAASGLPAPAPIVGSPAPDFTLSNTTGQARSLSDFKGRPVLINFWATWCGPCRIEMPAIEAAYQAHKAEGFTVLAVDLDEPPADVTRFMAELNLSFEALLDPGAVVNDQYRIRAYPSSFFVGRDGIIAAMQIGSMTESQLDANLAKILTP
ncbi:MAG: TlpA family protein disulfide reductase [Chloroflexi bacterium]|nr:TlpA family protein disulfide reductase [Chloroflexota bacterium]